MSHSWNSYFSATPSVQAGIAIGRNQICAVVLNANGAKHEIRAIHTHDMPTPIFSAQPTTKTEAVMVDALKAVSEEFRGEYASVHIALPDTVIRSTVFDLEELPKKDDMRKELLRWRFAKKWQRPEDSLDCRGYDLGEDRGMRLFFGQAGDRPWVESVRRALAQSEIVPWSLNAAAVYRFNCFHEDVAEGGGALLSLETDSWNLLLWDEKKRIRRVLTRLRENLTAEDEAASIAGEIERAIFAYVQGDGSRKVGRLYLAGNAVELASFAGAFNGRLSEPVVVLHADENISGNVTAIRDGLAPLALAAALNQ